MRVCERQTGCWPWRRGHGKGGRQSCSREDEEGGGRGGATVKGATEALRCGGGRRDAQLCAWEEKDDHERRSPTTATAADEQGGGCAVAISWPCGCAGRSWPQGRVRAAHAMRCIHGGWWLVALCSMVGVSLPLFFILVFFYSLICVLFYLQGFMGAGAGMMAETVVGTIAFSVFCSVSR